MYHLFLQVYPAKQKSAAKRSCTINISARDPVGLCFVNVQNYFGWSSGLRFDRGSDWMSDYIGNHAIGSLRKSTWD